MARRTFADYKLSIQHALGNAPATGESTTELVNDALQHLCSMYPWTWLRGGPVSLTLTADQNYVELPQDFAEIESLNYPGTVARQMLKSTVEEIERLRSYTTLPPGFVFTYAVNSGQTEEDFIVRQGGTVDPSDPTLGLSVNVLEIYPTPTDTVVDALSLVYRRQVDRLTEDADIPPIPVWMDYAFDLLCRSFAMTLEDDNPANSAQQMFDKIIPTLIRRDADTQRRPGVMKGGLWPRSVSVDPFYPTHIGDPS